jgi:hypothetical protein
MRRFNRKIERKKCISRLNSHLRVLDEDSAHAVDFEPFKCPFR